MAEFEELPEFAGETVCPVYVDRRLLTRDEVRSRLLEMREQRIARAVSIGWTRENYLAQNCVCFIKAERNAINYVNGLEHSAPVRMKW